MKKSLLILSALIAPTIAFSQDGPRPISLPEAVEMARKNSPQMISARGQIRTGGATLRQAKWAFSPLSSLQLGYNSSTSGGASVDAEGFVRQRPAGDWSFSQSFGSASLTIWDGGTKIGNVKSAHASIESAEASEVSTSFTIAQQVKAQYYTILQQRETEANARTAMAQAENQLRIASAKVRNGTANVYDTLTAFIAIQNQRVSILNAQNAQNTANATLTRLTASPYPVTAILSDTADPPPLTITDAELFALAENGPSVRTSMASLRSAEIAEKNSKAIYWPQITATGSYGRSNSDKRYDFGAGPMGYNWSFGLQASLRLFDNFAREGTIISRKVATDNAEANLREQKFTVRQNLTQQIGALRSAEQTIQIQRLSLVAAEEALRIATARYENGVGLQDAVITAQQNLNTTRTALTSARVSARNARAQIESIIGRDLPQ